MSPSKQEHAVLLRESDQTIIVVFAIIFRSLLIFEYVLYKYLLISSFLVMPLLDVVITKSWYHSALSRGVLDRKFFVE